MQLQIGLYEIALFVLSSQNGSNECTMQYLIQINWDIIMEIP